MASCESALQRIARSDHPHVEGPQAGHHEVISLGATLLQAAANFAADEGFTVYADPAGRPFCIGWGH